MTTTTIAVDGASEEEFRRSIEQSLRQDRPDEAAGRLRALLAPYAGPGRILPERFLTVAADELALTGWEGLAAAVQRHDRPGHPITALSIAFGWQGEDVPEPDLRGCLSPHLETGYFTDEAFPFSASGRDDLLEGYSYHGCTWAADCAATDTALTLVGIDDLNGALAALEARLLASDAPDEDEIRAGSLAACLLSVLLFEAVGQRIARDGLPRPLCVMAGSNGVYPYFDAPVAGIPEAVRKAAEAEEEEAALAIPAPRYSSLLMTGIPRAKKRAVLVLAESEAEMAGRIARLRGLAHGDPEPAPAEPEPMPEAPEPVALTGGPLMVKKPSGQSWDFRDLLSPRDAEPEAGEPALPPEPPALPAAPPLAAADEPPAQPGFTLLEPSLQDRLQALMAPREIHAAPVPTESVFAPMERPLPNGPLRPDWLDEDEPPVEPPPPRVETAAETERPGLWRRLRAWLTGRR